MPDTTIGSVNTNYSMIDGPVVGINLGTIIYGRAPEEGERQSLVRYLEQLSNSHRKIRVIGLGPSRLESGIDLASVYIMLAVQKRYRIVRKLTSFEIIDYQRQKLRIPHELKPDRCLPDQAIIKIGKHQRYGWLMFRAELATETIAQYQYLILCGAPGSGKSTFAKHLVWALAQRGLDQINHQTHLRGWTDKRQLLPIFMPLRQLAGALAGNDLGLHAEPKIGLLLDALCDYLQTHYGLDEPRTLLTAGLNQRHKVLFVFDGLDEVPVEANEHSLDRASLLRFLRIFADHQPNARMLITCRSRAWTSEYRMITQWPMHELAHLTGGQITHFVHYWFPQLVLSGVIGHDEAQRYSTELLKALQHPKRQKLRLMAENPLLLSMMIFVLAENGVLPRDRHSLYEQVLGQLLGQWDAKREGDNLGQAIGDERITSQELRNRVLDRLCYHAHMQALSVDGRGRIHGRELRLELMDYFNRVKVADPYRAAERCIAYIDQRSGLLHPEDAGMVYAFAHLTLQEHSAGRHLLFYESIGQILALRHDDRWREPIFLGVGCLTSESLGSSKISELLTALIDRYDYGSDTCKPSHVWYRDVVLAAELGFDRDWGLLSGTGIDVRRIKREIRLGVVQMLHDRQHAQSALEYFYGAAMKPTPLLVKERQHAAELLAGLGDPRYPIDGTQWQQETTHLSQQFGREGTHYWRYMPAGQYQRGDAGTDIAETIEKHLGDFDPAGMNHRGQGDTQIGDVGVVPHPYWIGQFMVTVEQYQAFIQAGGYHTDRWWSTHGKAWKTMIACSEPWWWEQQTLQQYINQPIYGVSWYEAVAYCNWLNHYLQPMLPVGYRVCVPSETEWMSAAYNDEHGQFHNYSWGNQPLTPEHAVYDWVEERRPAPVGLSRMGDAPCGAADMTGNLWEWTATLDGKQDEHIDESAVNDACLITLRGGSCYDNVTTILFAANDTSLPINVSYNRGFRCVIARR
ncbi:putative signal transduction protein with Nacht domain (plasmid) [Herpetosiphon aurantiacus DSM 785]|uniref:Signal transduction protein with Nacht domain n=1 Tax=Herpetosiphon aurantiacus (strain ATCC 23779 / DSM 785 / 114-95) TaxID=316274 RepID=A9B8X7_HERA2|nr:putative signal transduction protein with Nacht domain [Herpetosiphon aurantiacus DSM 785]